MEFIEQHMLFHEIHVFPGGELSVYRFRRDLYMRD